MTEITEFCTSGCNRKARIEVTMNGRSLRENSSRNIPWCSPWKF